MALNIKNFETKKFTSDSRQYLNDISKFEVPSPEDELMYFKLAKKGDKNAKDTLFMGHQRFIFALAKHFSKNSEDVLDYVNEGNIGLSIAFDKYDPTVGVRFITFASYYIRREMSQYYEYSEKIVIQSNKQKYKSKINKIKHDYFKEYGILPTYEEIISLLEEKYNIKIKDKSDVYDCCVNSINIDKDDDFYNSDFENLYNKKSHAHNEYEIEIKKEYIKSLVSKLLGELSERDADIIKMSYGIDYPYEYSNEDISNKHHLTPSRINMIKKQVISELKEKIVYRSVV